ncbi:MAG: hypothetical protein HZB16_04995 [Armatimonadetes bacterium]|nr:hypothetical protein [Armatimonadota bacterium]
MGKRLRRQWHAQNDSPGCARFGLGCLSLNVLPLAAMPLISLLAFLGIKVGGAGIMLFLSWLVVPSVIRGSLRAGIRADDEGLTECYPLGFRRRVLWADFTSAEVTDHRAVLHHPRGKVVLEPPLADWSRLAERAQRHLGASAPRLADDDVVALPPEEVALWLGIRHEGALVCTSGFHRWRHWWPWLLLASLALLRLPEGYLFWSVFMAYMVMPLTIAASGAGLWSVGGRRRDRRVREVRATPASLDVRSEAGWHTYAWGGLRSVSKRGLFWVVATTDGDLWLPPRLVGGERLLHAIREAIKARRQGFELPRLTGDVPEAALSRAELRVETERALSVAEADES